MGEYGQIVGQSSGGGGLSGGGGGLSGGGGQDLGGQFVTAISDTAGQIAGLPVWAQLLLLAVVIVAGLWVLRRAL